MSASFVIPAYIDGKPTWLPEVPPEMLYKLQNGDPTIGWEGDPRLYFRRNMATGGWTLWRIGEDRAEYAICISKAPHRIDNSLLIQLRDHDTRKVDVMARVEKQNEAAQKAQDTKEYEDNHEMLEKVYWALGKDLGNNA